MAQGLHRVFKAKRKHVPWFPQTLVCKRRQAIRVTRRLGLGVHHFANTSSAWVILDRCSSVAQSCPTLCGPMHCSTPGFLVHHYLPELAQTCVHWVGDVIQPSCPLSSPSPPTFNLSQHQGLFKRAGSSPQVAQVLEFQLQHQSFQWIFRVDFL